MRMKSLLKVISVNIFLLILGFAIVELVWGYWIFGSELEKLNLILNERYEFSANNLYKTNEKSITYTRDRYGLRGDYPKTSQIDILTIGGSATDQRYLSDDKTWQVVIEKNFLTQGNRISVVNAGVDGQTTRGNIENFKYWFCLCL